MRRLPHTDSLGVAAMKSLILLTTLMAMSLFAQESKVPPPFEQTKGAATPTREDEEMGAVAHPEQSLPATGTIVWTPLFQASWDALNAYHGGKPVKVDPPNALISRLDTFTWKPETVMPRGRWKTWAGPANEEFLGKANAEAAKISGEPEGPFQLEESLPGTVAVFGLLDREVSFQRAFFRSRKTPLTFHVGAATNQVAFFGVTGDRSADFEDSVHVLAYRPSEHCHALQILCEDSDETVVLFRPPATMDFATACRWLRTWRKAWADDPGRDLQHDDRRLHKRDEVVVPYLKLETTKDFSSELSSLRFYPGHDLPRRVARAEQRVTFELHERGARVKTEVSLEDPFGSPPEQPVHPRRFRYDVPFFVFLWRDGADWPYFGTWVGDTSAMEKIH
ncbi:MAG: hypothetical protein EAZ84_09330 [Verrucomicrobia bacterium]|nr:MAG: hypothetical protein EAZ84_09330 [Verrucomicrobiota bacterium]TAE86814.1 MAG: hypothetical protein EAZ82_09755 [Verrucomicrobiota bacterium]TAF24587.1 MAG: hypothetical protein EAZ71_09980 [Verrucomicrobiota bacterium]